MKSIFAAVSELTDASTYQEGLRSQAQLAFQTRMLLIASFGLLAVYGALIGAFGGPEQALSSALKLPLLFLLTALVCFPTLFILNQFAGAKVSAGQYVAVIQASIAVSSLILIAFAPISAFFLMTSTNYAFFKLLNVAILGFSAFMGVRFLYSHTLAISESAAPSKVITHRILSFWVVLFAFVGSQLGWTLRPFFGSPGMEFEVVREVGGNFYSDVARSMGDVIGLNEEVAKAYSGNEADIVD